VIEKMTALILSHKIGRAFLFASLAGLLYNLVQIYRLDAIAPYGIQSMLFLNAFILFLSLIYLEKSHRIIHLTGGIVSLSGIVLSALCYFDIRHVTTFWNYMLLMTATVITLTLFERLRKKTGSLALLAMVLCVITIIALSFILLTKHRGETILTLFNYLSVFSMIMMAIAIIFYARKDQSTKVP
jgi:hypothetical protein